MVETKDEEGNEVAISGVMVFVYAFVRHAHLMSAEGQRAIHKVMGCLHNLSSVRTCCGGVLVALVWLV